MTKALARLIKQKNIHEDENLSQTYFMNCDTNTFDELNNKRGTVAVMD